MTWQFAACLFTKSVKENISKNKRNLYYTRGILLATSGTTHLCNLAPRQHRNVAAVGKLLATMSDSTDPGIKPKASGVDSDVLNHSANRTVRKCKVIGAVPQKCPNYIFSV